MRANRIIGFEKYSISTRGRVKNIKTGKILVWFLAGDGYPTVGLYNKDGVCKLRPIHRLLALQFIPKIRGKRHVNHKDGNKLNFKLSNLEWCNESENVRHAYANNLIGNLNTRRGKDNHLSILSEEEVAAIKKEYRIGEIGQRPLAKKFGMSRGAIRSILKNRSWRHIVLLEAA